MHRVGMCFIHSATVCWTNMKKEGRDREVGKEKRGFWNLVKQNVEILSLAISRWQQMEIMMDPGSVPGIDPAVWIVCMNLLSNLLYNTKHNANCHGMLDLKCFQMHAVKNARKSSIGPKGTGAGIQGGEKSSYGGPRAYDNSL